MSAALKVKVGVFAAAFACVLASNAAAQQIDQNPPRDTSADRPTLGQFDRPQTEQTDRAITPENRRTTVNYGQRSDQSQAGNQDQGVERYVTNCLISKNNAEVEIGKLAQEQSQNPEVKQFAQQMVQNHQKLVQQLQQLAGAAVGDRSSSTGTSPALGAGQSDTQRQASDTTRLPGSLGAGQPAADRANRSLTSTNDSSGAIQQLMEMDRQITQRCTDALREELQAKQGAEFDKCYVGSQVGGHMHMLAALEVIGQQGPERLQQIAQQAQPVVQKHLDHAKTLMKQLESGSPASSQAERQSPQTQR